MPSPDFASLNGDTILTTLQEICTKQGASDIHLSPEKKHVKLLVRLHGVLQELAVIPHVTYQDLIRRVKFVAKLKLNLTNVPQDGQYTFPVEDRAVNVRVATLPSHFGEKLTLRLLDPQRGILPLQKLGFPREIEEELHRLVHLPNGLILVTGPTGSGKTTTLYALLSTMTGKNRNIITLEDPIEYELEGIVQSQIDPEHDFSFAAGLRAVLRHDPDVILVGEIRDQETAQTAINASLTGHLVLSTLHTNSAVEAIPRLLSMGVSPYTFAPALRAVLAQRLVRTVKEECRAPGAHCDPSNNDIYGGQMALPELLVVTPAIQTLIIDLDQGQEIEKQARKEHFQTMKEWGEKFIAEGRTNRQEIERVTA